MIALALGASAIAAFSAAPANDSVHGRVRAVRDGNIEVCFYAGYAPAADAEFTLLRNVVVAAPKTQTAIRRADVGTIQLSGAIEHGCATATLLRGKAEAADWIVALRADPR